MKPEDIEWQEIYKWLREGMKENKEPGHSKYILALIKSAIVECKSKLDDAVKHIEKLTAHTAKEGFVPVKEFVNFLNEIKAILERID